MWTSSTADLPGVYSLATRRSSSAQFSASHNRVRPRAAAHPQRRGASDPRLPHRLVWDVAFSPDDSSADRPFNLLLSLADWEFWSCATSANGTSLRPR